MMTHRRINTLKMALLAAFVLLPSACFTFGATVTVSAVADTSLFETNPDSNLGATELASGTTAKGLKSRALVGFDLAGEVPANAAITSVAVTFRVTKAPPGAVPSTFGLHRVLQSWGEGDKSGIVGDPATADEATWKARLFPATLWSTPGAAAPADYTAKASATRLVAGVGNYTFAATPELIADVQSWLANPGSNFGWILISQSENVSRTARRFASVEGENSAPTLVIQFSDAPQATAPTITGQPQSQNVAAGANVTFTVTATGTEPLTYQWKFNDAEIRGATRASLALSNVQPSNAGRYAATVSNAAGSVTSSAALLGVQAAPPAARNRWTIMIYGHADHNLSGSLIADMQEMEASGSAADFNIVLQADFDASSERNAAGGLPADLAKGVTRFLVQKDTDPNAITSPAIERLPETMNMDDPAVLTQFIIWAAQKYPADRYGLVLWNHGGQWQGFGGDSQDGTLQDKGNLSTAQIRQALASAMPTAGIAKWEFISFDTCLMGGAEVLADFVPLTDVFIACPEIDYGDGWEYEATFNFLKANPAVSAMDFGRAEVKAWEAHHLQPGKESDLELAAHALYDLPKFAAFEEKFNAFAALLGQGATSQNLVLPRLRLDTTQYSLSGVKEIGKPTDYIDLGEFADRLAAEASTDAALKAAATSLVASIDSLVAAKVRGAKKQLTHGLSAYYPATGSKGDPGYLGLTLSSKPGSSWSQFLVKVADNKAGDNTAPEIAEGDVAPASVRRSASSFSASITQPASVRVKILNGPDAYAIYASIVDDHFTAKTNEFVYLGEILYAPVKGVGTYNVQWNGTLPMLSNTAGTNAVILGGFFEDVGSDILISFAEYVPPGSTDTQFVALLTQLNGNKGVVIGVLDAEVEELAPEGIDVEPGGTLTPVYYLERRLGDDPDNWESDEVRGKASIMIPASGLDGLTVSMAQLPSGTYTMEAQVVDFYGNESEVLEYAILIGAPQQTPTLKVQAVAPDKLKLSWPASASEYTLEANAALSPTGWNSVPANQLVIEGASKAFTDTVTGAARFYRLRKN